MLHGDLTPGNILDGGAKCGLVAIDPALCRGDAAFEAVDLILWQAGDLQAIQANQAARRSHRDGRRGLSGWCTAFAAMSALELVSQRNNPGPRIHALLELASRA